MKYVAFLLALLPSALSAAEPEPAFRSEWRGSGRFVGPEYWANPMYDWKREDGAVIVRADANRTLHLLTHRVASPAPVFNMYVEVEILAPGKLSMPDRARAGFAIGNQGLMDDHRHLLVGTQRSIKAGIRGDGKLFIDDMVSDRAFSDGGPVTLRLSVTPGSLLLSGHRNDTVIDVKRKVDPSRLLGNLALVAESPRKRADKRPPIRARFRNWLISDATAKPTLASDPDATFGPILWSQYTYAGGVLKLSAQFAPVTGKAVLEMKSSGQWQQVATTDIDPLSRTAVFRWEMPDLPDTPYRVRYQWQGRDYFWEGTVRAEPSSTDDLRIAAFSCDHGYAFPQPKLVARVLEQNPDLVYFAGDQIYEGYGGFGIIRQPTELAALDYLRKYYQFGWTWRDVLKDRPSIIIPDDHDVFQGNIWGHGGRRLPAGMGFEAGGYKMHPDWVRAVERTQTSHLPDPADPAPVKQGIGVYFTKFTYGGIPFAVLEDRKFKSGPVSVLPKGVKRTSPEAVDPPGAQLLGPRQEQFLVAWAAETKDAPVRFVLSQTIFCQACTHTGPSLRKAGRSTDTNGWPVSGRNRALKPLCNNPNTVMMHGDQHFGILLRQGVDRHGDGPLAFMVPGTANGYPRAWWPEGPDAPASSWTGDFTDPFGHKITVLAAANPEKGSNTLNPRKTDHPETTAHKKGSGHGVVTIDRKAKTLTFDMWRYHLAAAKPKPSDQFPGFPKTLPLKR